MISRKSPSILLLKHRLIEAFDSVEKVALPVVTFNQSLVYFYQITGMIKAG